MSIYGPKITNVRKPTDTKDVATKEYVDGLTQRVHAVGRYVVISKEEDGMKTYFSVRAKKNVDLNGRLRVELKNAENEFFLNPKNTPTRFNFTSFPNPDKDLGFLRVQPGPVSQIQFEPGNYLTEPWTLLFSARFRTAFSPLLRAAFPRFSFIISTKQSDTFLLIVFEDNIIKYSITQDVNNAINTTEIRVDTSRFNHIAFKYSNDNLTTWLNGELQRTRENVTLNRLYEVRIGGSGDLGLLSLYDRELNKQEIVQHFIDYHVLNFTNDKVLI